MNQLSDRLNSLSPSATLAMSQKSAELKAQGVDVINLSVGEPDFNTPDHIKEAAKQAIDENYSRYSPVAGYPALRNAIVAKLKNENGLDYTAAQISCANGAKQSVCNTILTLVNPGDEVIVPAPYWVSYPEMVKLAEGKPVIVTAGIEQDFKMTPAQLEAAITPKTKAICIINPGNPTGKVLTRDEMKLIVDIALAHDLFIIADEVYREFVYDGKEMSTFGSFKEAEQNVIIVDSVSKRFSACGARIGSIASKNEELMNNLMKLAQARLCCPTIDQIGAAALYNLDPSYFDDIKKEYEHRRNVSVEALNEIEGIKYGVPEGAFYITAQLPVDNAEDFLMFLLTEFDVNGETVMFAPAGGFFGTPGVGQSDMRIAYVLNAEDMKAGINIIKEGIKAYNNR